MSRTYTIDPNYNHLLSFVENIKERFNGDCETIHDGRNVLKIFEVENTKVVVKSFKVPNIINQVIYSFFRDSKAARSYMYSQKLISFGINTPHPIAFIEHRHLGLFKESYYICEHFNFDFEIRAVLKDAAFPDRKKIFKEFAKFSYKLHEAGVYHVDYSPGNVLIQKDGEHYTFMIVDVNRMEFMDFTDELRMKNLSRFSASVEDTKMIAQFYAEVAGLNANWAVERLEFYHEKHQEYIKRKKELKKLKKRS